LDRDLAALYGVTAKVLNQAVKRNKRRFPRDFMFQLNSNEALRILRFVKTSSRSQFVTLKRGQNIKYLPYAFTEQGVAMLSSVLKCAKAVQVNIAIMRVFVRLRYVLATHRDLADKLDRLERKFGVRLDKHDVEIHNIFAAIRQLMEPPAEKPRKIGFIVDRE